MKSTQKLSLVSWTLLSIRRTNKKDAKIKPACLRGGKLTGALPAKRKGTTKVVLLWMLEHVVERDKVHVQKAMYTQAVKLAGAG